jgi:hypothetical protein
MVTTTTTRITGAPLRDGTWPGGNGKPPAVTAGVAESMRYRVYRAWHEGWYGKLKPMLLPDLDGSGRVRCRLVKTWQHGPLTVLEGVPPHYLPLVVPLARALGLERVVLAVADLSGRSDRPRGLTFWGGGLECPAIFIDDRRVAGAVTESFTGADGRERVVPAWVAVLVHELMHARFGDQGHTLVPDATARWIVGGVLPQ